METCSNCGASVRPGAKFCTGCGNRLNDVDTSGSGSSGWNETAPVENAPSSDESSVGRVVSTRILSDGADTPVPESTGVANEQPATTWTWGSLETDDPAARVPVTPVEGSGQSSSSAVSDRDPATATSSASEPFQWSWDRPSNAEPAAEATATEDDARPVSEPMADASLDTSLTYRPSDSPTADAGGDAVAAPDAVEPASTPPPYDWQQSATYAYGGNGSPAGEADAAGSSDRERGEPAAATSISSNGDGSGLAGLPGSTDSETRVLDLLDQLRSLIPELAASRTTGSDTSADATGGQPAEREGRISDVISDLERAREGVGASDDLRAVLEAATSRPRDMDVVLDLVGRAGNLIDLLDERDRLVAAIEQATSALRASS